MNLLETLLKLPPNHPQQTTMAWHKGNSGMCRICEVFANLTLKLQSGENGGGGVA